MQTSLYMVKHNANENQYLMLLNLKYEINFK